MSRLFATFKPENTVNPELALSQPPGEAAVKVAPLHYAFLEVYSGMAPILSAERFRGVFFLKTVPASRDGNGL